ncbi:MAG: class I SAM-dependent methyltransferase [Phycisphaerae bacterium]|nr:class I SAM-dependent methyltransferase [Phycisphaerae bacterium]MBT6268829.1 class I SAM-dependent methyltransferase [Phycisphaerae bacterium]MBT6281994.1 class I SAM-dependent methyltransferase [Phycisphaerae bacterium]
MAISHPEPSSVQHASAFEVVVATQDVRLHDEAKQLKQVIGKQNRPTTFIVYFGQGGVEIRRSNKADKKGHKVDFNTIDRRTGAGNLSRKQLFPKAIGNETKTVLDITAGLGADSAMLALMGYTVRAVERSPIISVLLRDGLHRANKNPELHNALGGRLALAEADSRVIMQNIDFVDVVYMDPMFPPKRKKSALPQGSIQMLQAVVGYDDDVQTKELFDLAMNTATKRVVVKRPNYAPFFRENPTFVHKGKLVRYEVYGAQK